MNDNVEEYLWDYYAEILYEDQDLVNNFIRTAIDIDPPPLFRPKKFNGSTVKEYSFLSGSSGLKNLSEDDLNKKVNKIEFRTLSAYKEELEQQLKMYQNLCFPHYKSIKQLTANWINDKFHQVEHPLNLNETEILVLKLFFASIKGSIYLIMNGYEKKQVREFVLNDYTVSINKENVAFTKDEYIKVINDPFEQLQDIISQSLKVFLEYLKVCYHLNQFDIDELFSKQNYLEIPNEKILQIESFADKGKKKYKKGCIAFLTMYEKYRETFKPINKKSVKVRQIKKQLNFKGKLPTKKVLAEWIEAYDAMFYPEEKK